MNIPTPKLSTLGCRLNAYETEAMRELATSSGLNDAVIINTCAVTAEAVRKSKQEIRKLRKENPSAKWMRSSMYVLHNSFWPWQFTLRARGGNC